MTDSEVAAVIGQLEALAVALKLKMPGRSATVNEGVAALKGLLTERYAWAAERAVLLVKMAALEQAASGQLYRDIAYGVKDAWIEVGQMPSMLVLQKAVDALPPKS